MLKSNDLATYKNTNVIFSHGVEVKEGGKNRQE